MKKLFLLIFTSILVLFKASMAEDLEDYINKGHVEVLVEALKYSDASMFDEATNEIKKTNNENLLLFIKWLKLREGKGSFSEYSEFLKYHEHWPQKRLLKKFGELSIDESVKRRDIQTFFKVGADCKKLKEVSSRLYEDDCLPQTAQGSIALLQILNANTNTEFFNEVLEKLVVRQTVTDKQWNYLNTYHKSKLAEMATQRFKHFKKKSDLNELDRISIFLDEKELKILKDIKKYKKIKKLSKNFTYKAKDFNDVGVAYDYISLLRRSGQFDLAQNLIRKNSSRYFDIIEDERWLQIKQIYSLRALRGGYANRAYEIANTKYNFSDDPNTLSDFLYLEWLAGFIALEFFNDPKLAKKHFLNFFTLLKEWEEKSNYLNEIGYHKDIISLDIASARIGYWLGKTFIKLGDKKSAQKFFSLSANYDYSFYGQLSLERLKINPSPRYVTKKDSKGFKINNQKDLVEVAASLYFAERGVLSDYIFGHLAKGLSEQERYKLCHMLQDAGFIKGSLTVAKKSTENGTPLHSELFPTSKDFVFDQNVDKSLVLSVIRQESEFFRAAKSRTGALGLMQLMPNTAKEVARKLKIKYKKSKLITNENYNIRLGSYYLKYLLKRYDGSKVLTLAAYNAGPANLKKWLSNMGDPRKKGIDPLVWIELIPYPETRNYVKRVLEAIWIYDSKISESIEKPNMAKKYFGHRF